MPFRASFDCLWCGQPHEARGPDDLEGWASLCPTCIGRADENGFLRSRLRAGLRERAAAARSGEGRTTAPSGQGAGTGGTPTAGGGSSGAAAGGGSSGAAPVPAHDDWYLRRGAFARGPLVDQPWIMELDEVTRWLDELPLKGRIVELTAGAGWWSTLLAGKGELWIYDADGTSLDAARRRLMAHGLLAHLHQRDPLAAPDEPGDAVFAAYLLGGAGDERQLHGRLAAVRGWLKPGGIFTFIEPHPDAPSAGTSMPGPAGPLYPRGRQTLERAFEAAGLVPLELVTTARSFAMGRAVRAGGWPGPRPASPGEP